MLSWVYAAYMQAVVSSTTIDVVQISMSRHPISQQSGCCRARLCRGSGQEEQRLLVHPAMMGSLEEVGTASDSTVRAENLGQRFDLSLMLPLSRTCQPTDKT